MLRHLIFVLLIALPIMVNASIIYNDIDIGHDNIERIDTSTWLLPLDVLLVTDTFGEREEHPVTGEETFHAGIDFRARFETPIYAVTDGWVIIADTFPNYGKMIEIDHIDDNISTRYAHLDRFADGIVLGVEVKQGQLLGYAGNTGRVTASHLHFEILIQGIPHDPFLIYGELPCKWNVEHELCGSYEL